MKSKYHIDTKSISLDTFLQSLKSRRLIPSRVALKDKIEENFIRIESAGIKTLGDLLAALKTVKITSLFAEELGVAEDYLTLLRREANSYLPNPVQLNKFPKVSEQLVSMLGEIGIRNSKQLFDQADDEKARANILHSLDIKEDEIFELFALADLCRLYGVGPAFARLLYDVGIESVEIFLTHTAEELIKIYESKSQKKADFTADDLFFSQEIAKSLYISK